MKAVAYSIKPHEKECLALANGKRHDLTLISNELNTQTVFYAKGKETVIISPYDILDRNLLWELKHAGVTNIVTRSRTTTHIDLNAAAQMRFRIVNAPGEQTPEALARQVIANLDQWERGGCVGGGCCCRKTCRSDQVEDDDRHEDGRI